MLGRVVNALVAPLGLEIRRRRARPGEDPFRDMKALAGDCRSPLIIDVGANEGQSVANFRRVFKSPRIHAFEPSRSTFDLLQRSTSGIADLRLNNCAVGARESTLVMRENSSHVMSSPLRLGRTGWGRITSEYEVPVVALDDYCERNRISKIDILKSDTQGYETEVLAGSARMLGSGNVHMVFVELILSDMYQDLPRWDLIVGFLLDRDFKLVAFCDANYQEGRLGWLDALFVNTAYCAGTPSQ